MAVSPKDLARALVARQRGARAADRQRAEGLLARVAEAMEPELRSGKLKRAWLIGSLAWGGFGVRSDVDLVVEGLPPEAAGRLWARLGEALKTDLDLMRLEALPVAFRKRVLTSGVPLHRGDSGVA